MGARFDHLVVAVEDLDEAVARWRAAGIPAERGGAHPVGTVNALVRGPGAAYVELIAAGGDETNPWLDRVRTGRGPISWAIAVDDLEAAREALAAAGLDPGPAVPGSRRTPDGDLVEWQVCDVGPGPYDGSLPFLIRWTTPMAPGTADGPVVEHVDIAPPDPDRVADVLLALGLEASEHWPRRAFRDGAGVRITLGPLGPPPEQGEGSWSMTWEDPDAPDASLVLRTSCGTELVRHTLDGVALTLWPDRRCFAASTLQPTAGDDSAAERAEAWVRSVVGAGLGAAEQVDVSWAGGGTALEVTGATRVTGPAGTQPITVVRGAHPLDLGEVVVVGIGDPVEVLERQPEPHTLGTACEVGRVDDAFVQALSGGVYAVRDGHRSVVRHLDGHGSTGLDGDEARRWLAEADAGSRTDGVVGGAPWVS